MFADQLAERTEWVTSESDYQKVLNKFEAFGKKRVTQKQGGNQGLPEGRWMVITKCVAKVTAAIGIALVRLYLIPDLKSSKKICRTCGHDWNHPAVQLLRYNVIEPLQALKKD